MKLSLIIPCLNAASTIAAQLEALANQDWSDSWEVIISDNGSTDSTLEIVKQYRPQFPALKIVDSSDRRGAAHARNIGAALASGEVLLFCDADDEVAPGWINAMVQALSRYDFAAGYIDLEKLNSPCILKKKQLRHSGVIHYLNYLPAASSWGLGVKRSIHEAVGGFDQSMLRLQDIDYCWRIQQMGIKLHAVPDAIVYYRYPHRLIDIFRKARLDGEYQIFLYKKHGPFGMPKLAFQTDLSKFMRVLLRRLPLIRDKSGRVVWTRQFAHLLGRFQGRIKYGIFSL